MMPFVKGQSGNPLGRPRKKRALAETLLEKGLSANPECPPFSNQQVLAILIWRGLTAGAIHFGGSSYVLTQQEWFDLLKWASQHLDGKLLNISGPTLDTTIDDFRASYPDASASPTPFVLALGEQSTEQG